MVQPSIDADDRSRAAQAFKIGFTLLFGVSAALVSVQAGAGTRFALTAMVVALPIGAVLTWFTVRELRKVQPDGLAERRKRGRE